MESHEGPQPRAGAPSRLAGLRPNPLVALTRSKDAAPDRASDRETPADRSRASSGGGYWRSMLKVAAATALYGVFHSAVASLAAKEAAARLFGSRNRNGLYRVFYIAQSLLTFALLAAYVWRLPNRDLYNVRGRLAKVMHAGQFAALLYATWAARQVGIRRITGLESFPAWLRRAEVPQEPEAQGPALDAEGKSNPIGPFAWSRHPLNFVPMPIFWLWPRMTAKLLAFNLTALVYLVLGSVHEELRLRRAHGDEYRAYQRSGVSFYLPLPRRNPLRRTDETLHLERP